VETKEDGSTHDFFDRTFKLLWKKIDVKCSRPIPRSSHSMNLFMNRFLVLIGGETSTAEKEPKTEKNEVSEEPSNSIRIKIEDVDSPTEE
jgi:hypothetical protein